MEQDIKMHVKLKDENRIIMVETKNSSSCMVVQKINEFGPRWLLETRSIKLHINPSI